MSDNQITAEHVQRAFAATEWHRSQVQGFLYPTKSGLDRHVVRDLTKSPGTQTVWEVTASRDDYEMADERSWAAIESYRAGLLASALCEEVKREERMEELECEGSA